MKSGSILIADDIQNVLSSLQVLLSGDFNEVHLLSSPEPMPNRSFIKKTPTVFYLERQLVQIKDYKLKRFQSGRDA